jgi:replicative DNA helicase
MNPSPCSKEAEIAVIGSVLVNPSCFKEIDLAPDDFYFGASKETWVIFQELSTAHKVIDVVTVLQRATEKNLDSTINMDYLIGAINDTPSSINYGTYSEIVKDKAKRREFIRIAEKLALEAFDEKIIIDEKIPGVLSSLINSSRPSKTMEHISKPLSELYDDIQDKIEHPQEVWGLSSGIPGFDRITGGLQKKEATIITGKPGTGKSLLCVQFGFHMAKENHGGAIFEMEMNNLQTLRRQLSIESGVEVYKMKSGKVGEGDETLLTKGIDEMTGMPVYISDASSWTTSSMRSELTRLKMMYKIEWFILDYLLLLKDRYGANEIERQNYISIAVKDICKDLDLVGLVINSVNKTGQTSGSNQIQHDVDNNIMMELSDQNTPATEANPLINLVWDKQREGIGASRIMTLIKKPGFPCFYENISNESQFKPTGRKQDYRTQ